MDTQSALMSGNARQQPSLFVPHGAPSFALAPGAAGSALKRAASSLRLPRAVIIVSAHWWTAAPTVGFAMRPATIHDYYGFPAELKSIVYPATGCQEGANRVMEVLRAAGFDAVADPARGIDHGAWIPLRQMFPDADVPVIPLSIQPGQCPAFHLALGAALRPLTTEGFLIIASGNLTHNLGDYQRAHFAGGRPPAYVREFADWIWQRLESGNVAELLDYRRLAPAAEQAHPEHDHLLPLYVALGAAGQGARAERLHAGIDSYVLAMDAFAFHPALPAQDSMRDSSQRAATFIS